MKKLLVTGCNGQLGRAINQVYAGNEDVEIFNTGVGQEGVTSLDITDLEEVLRLVEEIKPYAIINCAAYTAVDACEVHKDLAYKTNAIGPRNLSIAATKNGAKLIHMSTDYVFAGDNTEPYKEFDAPNPKSAYGETKLAGERFVQQFADKYFIIRTAWLYGDGKNFVKTMLSLSEKYEQVSVVDDQIGNPTSAKELAKAIAALVPTENYGLFHGTCEGVCSWADLAAETFRLAGKSTKVEYISTEEYTRRNPTSAKRPAYSVLDNYMLKLTTDFQFPDWKDALKEYMETL